MLMCSNLAYVVIKQNPSWMFDIECIDTDPYRIVTYSLNGWKMVHIIGMQNVQGQISSAPKT